MKKPDVTAVKEFFIRHGEKFAGHLPGFGPVSGGHDADASVHDGETDSGTPIRDELGKLTKSVRSAINSAR